MKKILVVLLVLAVAGGVFAQEGKWSFSGGVKLSPTVNLDGRDILNTKTATVFGGRYLDFGNGGDEPRGYLDAAYTWGSLKATLSFLVNPATYDGGLKSADKHFDTYMNTGSLTAKMEYTGDRFKFYAETPFRLTLNESGGNIARLWGFYDLLGGIVHLEAGYRGADQKWWTSDTTAYKADWWSNTQNRDTNVSGSMVDVKRSTLLANVKVNQIQFGILVPNLMNSYSTGVTMASTAAYWRVTYTNPATGVAGATRDFATQPEAQAFADAINGLVAGAATTAATVTPIAWKGTVGEPNATKDVNGKATNPYGAVIDGALLKSVVGIKFTMNPFDFATQFMFEDAGVYLGAKYTFGPTFAVGLSFQGVMSPPTGYQIPVLAGLNLDYKQDAFGIGLNILYGVNGNVKSGATAGAAYGPLTHSVAGASSLLNYAEATDTTLGTGKYLSTDGLSWTGPQTAFGIEPNFYYNAIPDYLRFRVEAGFYFRGSDIKWKLIPQLTWNFLGTKANDIGSIATGMGVKYALQNEYGKRNLLSAVFKWGF